LKVEATMKVSTLNHLHVFVEPRKLTIVAALLLAAVGMGGWARSITPNTSAAELVHASVNLVAGDPKPNLIGSYEVNGTDPDGTPYVAPRILDIALTPSGALELEWDNGKNVGVGQIIGNTLAVASFARGRMVLLIMTINPDGSLTGKLLRRTDRGQRGTEVWTRK
jgi:hypothetical protein